MGLKCQVEEKNGIVDVKAPNGNTSLLYKTAEKVLGSKDKAMAVWATAYTPSFLSYYGDWINPGITSYFNTDSNGEPVFNDVIKYMERETYMTGSLTPKDVKDIKRFILQSSQPSIRDLILRISHALSSKGSMVLNEHTLKKSGLYTDVEIQRILSNISVQNQVATSLHSIVDYADDYVDSAVEEYYLTSDPVAGHIILKDSFDQFGKQESYNPGEIDLAIKEAAAGITNRADFDNRITSINYPEFVDKYQNDLDFANRIYEEYFSLSVLPEMAIEDGQLTSARSRTYHKLEDYSFYNASKVDSWKDSVRKMVSIDDWYDTEEVIPVLKELEKTASEFGIDIIGLSDAYESNPELSDSYESLVLATDIHISRLGKSDTSYQLELSNIIDSVLGRQSRGRVASLPRSMEGQALAYVESPLSDTEMYNLYSMLKVAPNVYQRVEKADTETLYSSLASLLQTKPFYLSASAYSSFFFKDGALNVSKIENADNTDKLLDSLKKYVISFTDSNNTEDMVLTRLAFGNSPIVTEPEVDIDREYNKYILRSNKRPASNIASRLYSSYLSNKLGNTDLYRSVYQYLDFKPEQNIGLTISDPYTLKSIDLSAEGRLRSDLNDLSLRSLDPSISNLFYVPAAIEYRGTDFYHYLYTNHPELLQESKAEIVPYEDFVVAEGTYDDFIKVNGVVMMKTGEATSGSVYQNIVGTEAEVKEATTEVSKKTVEDNSKNLIYSDIKLFMSLTKADNDKLSRLECV